METKEIDKLVERLTKETNNFTKGLTYSTLISWEQSYDDMNRPLICDPNYKDGSVIIDKKEYYFTKIGWYVYIWKDKRKYTDIWSERLPEYLLRKLDLAPDYVKEYRRTNGVKSK